MRLQQILILSALACKALGVMAEPGCQITAYGVLKLDDQDHASVVTTTSTIKAQIGLLFGVGHHFRGLRDDETVRFRVLYSQSSKGPFSSVISDIQLPNDYESSYFGFDEAEEMKPGTWRFVYSAKGKELCAKTFSVTTSGD